MQTESISEWLKFEQTNDFLEKLLKQTFKIIYCENIGNSQYECGHVVSYKTLKGWETNYMTSPTDDITISP